jgi:hypothetical protein
MMRRWSRWVEALKVVVEMGLVASHLEETLDYRF